MHNNRPASIRPPPARLTVYLRIKQSEEEEEEENNKGMEASPLVENSGSMDGFSIVLFGAETRVSLSSVLSPCNLYVAFYN